MATYTSPLRYHLPSASTVAAAYWPPPFLCTGIRLAAVVNDSPVGFRAVSGSEWKSGGLPEPRTPHGSREAIWLCHKPLCAFLAMTRGKHGAEYGAATIRRTGFAGSRNDFCGAEFALRETKIISLRFLRPETPQSFSKKRSLSD